MRMKPSRNFFVGLCSMLALGFLYYSSGRISLRGWGHKSLYDKQGFLLKLDASLPLELVYKYGNLSEGACKPGYAAAKMTAIYPKLEKLDCPPKKIGRISQYCKFPKTPKATWRIGQGGWIVREKTSGQFTYPISLSTGDTQPSYPPGPSDDFINEVCSQSRLFTKLAPMFLDPNYKRFLKIGDYSPPFGIKSQEKIIDILLSATKSYGLGEELDSMSCKTCIIVGNGGILANRSLGQRIDEFDVVVRLNEAPVKGFEKDVGSKTTMRITYPEGAIQKTEHYETQSLFVLSAFKALDFRWLRHMVFNQRLHSTDGFWKSVARYVPREPKDMRILNPYFIQEASFKLIGLPHNNGQMGRGNIPTLGAVAITMALHNCDEVAVAGFGYNMSTPHAPLHYYEKIRMSAIRESWTHNISKEKEFLLKLVKAGVIQDWTNGICGAEC